MNVTWDAAPQAMSHVSFVKKTVSSLKSDVQEVFEAMTCAMRAWNIRSKLEHGDMIRE